jgi:ATPase family associated with various cellular activities (AAA)
MASVSTLIELFRAISAGKIDNARDMAEALCLAEEQRGHHTAARRLRGALKNTAARDNAASVTALAPGTIVPLLPLAGGLSQVALPKPVRKDLSEVVLEWQRRDQLGKLGIPRRSKLLLHGPPGCGKSLTARGLAHELGLPAYVARFDSIIGSFLGQTAVHLRQLFHFTEVTPCLLLLDELDALGKARGNPLDVGELDRIVIALMQELEHCVPKGMVIATTNLAKNLDSALWRRFDTTLLLPYPKKPELVRYAADIARRHQLKLNGSLRAKILRVQSYAAAEKLVEGEARHRILHTR